MKQALIILFSFMYLNSNSQIKKYYNINQKLDSKDRKEIVLVNVIQDSRCPAGVQCIWEGEVIFEVAAYENKKLIEQVQFSWNYKNLDEIKKWFELHLPKRKKQLKELFIIPGPKSGKEIKNSDYYIQLAYY